MSQDADEAGERRTTVKRKKDFERAAHDFSRHQDIRHPVTREKEKRTIIDKRGAKSMTIREEQNPLKKEKNY